MIENRPSTARIYIFPVKPRAPARAASPNTMSAVDNRAPRAPMADFGSGWYHDAAIQKEPVSPHAG